MYKFGTAEPEKSFKPEFYKLGIPTSDDDFFNVFFHSFKLISSGVFSAILLTELER